MVDRSDLEQANILNARAADLKRALAIVECSDAAIDAFTVKGRPDTAAEPQLAHVSAEGIVTPPQMLTAIKQQMEARIKAMNEQLTEMGVSESPPPEAPEEPEEAEEAQVVPPEPPPSEPPPEPPQTPVSASGGTESRPTRQTPAREPAKPAARPTHHTPPHKGRR